MTLDIGANNSLDFSYITAQLKALQATRESWVLSNMAPFHAAQQLPLHTVAKSSACSNYCFAEVGMDCSEGALLSLLKEKEEKVQ